MLLFTCSDQRRCIGGIDLARGIAIDHSVLSVQDKLLDELAKSGQREASLPNRQTLPDKSLRPTPDLN